MENNLHKKEIELKKLEQNSIRQKAQLIMEYSDTLLTKINNDDETFLKSLIAFLMCNSNNDFEMNYKPNKHYNYTSSLSVIFKLCSALPYLGFSVEENENIRNKLRIYTKYFKINHEADKKENKQFVDINWSQYKYVIETKKHLK